MNQTILLILKYRYAILLPFAIFEGPIFALLVGFLIYVKVLAIIPAFLIMVLGDFIPDSIYYFLGYYGHEKGIVAKIFSKEGVIFGHLEIIKELWTKHTRKTLFISKLSYGLSTPLLIIAGIAKVPYKKFISYALFVTIFQYGLFMSIGYYLGYSYQAAANYAQYTSILFAVILILFIGGYTILTKQMRKRFIKLEEKEEKTIV